MENPNALDGPFDEAGAFPGPGDTLFPAASAAKTAPSPSTGQVWYDYTTGYKEAADLLVAHVEVTGWLAVKIRYPILFLYRQHLELVVKNLIRVCHEALGHDQDFPRHHELDQLWQICARLLREISPAAAVDEVHETTRLFREFRTVDPAADAFRFPEDKRGNASFAGTLEVDLTSVRDIVEKMSRFLDCIDTSIKAERDAF